MKRLLIASAVALSLGGAFAQSNTAQAWGGWGPFSGGNDGLNTVIFNHDSMVLKHFIFHNKLAICQYVHVNTPIRLKNRQAVAYKHVVDLPKSDPSILTQ